MRLFPFFAAFGIVLGFSTAGIGYRTLWADEQETAERARAVDATGLPRIYDPAGNLSVNAAGREIEEGDLHRYTPWVQFYAGALGLRVGRIFGLSPDVSIRLPFVTAHALTSGIIAEGLATSLSLNPAVATLMAVAYGAGSVRMIHARTARYHALTDFLFMLAWFIFGAYRRRKPGKSGTGILVALGITLVALLHTQTIVGLLGAAVFSLLFFCEERFSRRTALLAIFVGFGVITLFALVRPWEQGPIWGSLHYQKFRGLRSGFEVGYAVFFFPLSFLVLSGFRAGIRPGDGWTREFLTALVLFFGVLIAVRLLDLHPYSQSRYYLPVIGLFLFWPLAIGGPTFAESRAVRTAYSLGFFAIFLFAELGGGVAPFQGLRMALFDSQAKTPQPLRELIGKIQATGTSGDGVFAEYTPQMVNWYLPDFRPALVPDNAALSPLGRKNPSLPPLLEPVWHIGYTNRPGYWVCNDACDARKIVDPKSSDRYFIESRALGKRFAFCIVGRWPTSDWNNAPYVNYLSGLSATGPITGELILSKRCD